MLTIIQIAGHSQSPWGIFAITSTFPKVMDFFPLVVRRALRTGLMMAPEVLLERMEHWLTPLAVHVPSMGLVSRVNSN
jgi:hypothetical protein